MPGSSLIALGDGVYTVPQVCRILQPSMTSRKVHYWLDTALLPEPISWGRRGHPTLLSFQHLLQVRTAQHLRDHLDFSLKRVRTAFQWLFDHLFAPDWADLRFTLGVGRELIVVTADGESCVIPGGQGVLTPALGELNAGLLESRSSWEKRRFVIPSQKQLVSDARVQGGAPTIIGTRIETAFLASFADGETFSETTLAELEKQFPRLNRSALRAALEFEGLSLAS